MSSIIFMQEKTQDILTVSQLTQAIKRQLETGFPHVLLKGEISNLKLQSSGHLYFSLKDAFAQITCVMFRQDLLKVQVPLKVGDQIVVQGEMNVYPPKGNYQLIIKELSLLGLGEILMKLELLKQKLQQKGYFEQSRKRKLPAFPKRIGVITSPTGAVIRDIIHVLTRRVKNFQLILNPVRVQGDGAADEIARAIDECNQYNLADVLIVCRGGGSIEDLMPFNDEKVAEAIFRSKIPIVSAVGHETDTSISDYVADVRAPTPSAAAEIVSAETAELIQALLKIRRQMQQLVIKTIMKARQDLARLQRNPIFNSTTALLGPTMQRLDDYRDLLDQSMRRQLTDAKTRLLRLKRNVELLQPMRKIKENKTRLQTLDKAITASTARHIQQAKKSLENISSHLQSLNPKSVLQKGYSICFSQKDGHVITSVKAMSKGDDIRLIVSDGEAEATLHTIYDTTRTLI